MQPRINFLKNNKGFDCFSKTSKIVAKKRSRLFFLSRYNVSRIILRMFYLFTTHKQIPSLFFRFFFLLLCFIFIYLAVKQLQIAQIQFSLYFTDLLRTFAQLNFWRNFNNSNRKNWNWALILSSEYVERW